jgi:N-acetylglucosamine-6-phosphate deacetylase
MDPALGGDVRRRRFHGGHVLIEGELVRADVVVDGEVVVDVVTDVIDDEIPAPVDDRLPADVDCRERVISAGFIDLQCNGADGVDITNEPHRILDVAAALPRFGVTSFLPTVVTAPSATRAAAIATMTSLTALAAQSEHRVGDRRTATPLGLHFEGPMLSPHHLGAHVPRFAAEPESLLDEIGTWTSSGAVALVTLAPELARATDVIERLVAAGIVVSAGHTAMTPSDFAAARAAGLSYVTHLFNAMAPFGHRSPGPIGAVLADSSVTAGVICDGIHVHPTAVAMAWRSLGPTRLSLVSDASPALGAPYGRFRIGGFEVVHDETGVRTVDGVLAGSTLALDQAVRNLMAFAPCSLADALATVTTTPADLLGLADRGRIRPGARADLTILDRAGELHATVIGGEIVWERL